MSDDGKLILVDQIEPLIRTLRGQKVLLDSDLADLYGVSTKRLNEQVRRNLQRFPEDFIYRLTSDETAALRSQNASSYAGRGGRRSLPYVFTEHGTIMAAMILNSERAVEVSVFVVRAFLKLREFALAHKELAAKLDQLDKKVAGHDDAIRHLVDAIRQLMRPAAEPKRGKIGFAREHEK